ncbi:MAG: hypothetical protein WD876_01330 [Candidatus Pacearchaeota archaeon]
MGESEVRYVKLESDEAVVGKRDLLSSQMNLLRILKSVKNYHNLRLKELKAKSKLYSNAKEFNQNLRKIQFNIPKLTTSHSFIKEKETGKIGVRERMQPIKSGGDRDLEIQLRDIQEKLRALQ